MSDQAQAPGKAHAALDRAPPTQEGLVDAQGRGRDGGAPRSELTNQPGTPSRLNEYSASSSRPASPTTAGQALAAVAPLVAVAEVEGVVQPGVGGHEIVRRPPGRRARAIAAVAAPSSAMCSSTFWHSRKSVCSARSRSAGDSGSSSQATWTRGSAPKRSRRACAHGAVGSMSSRLPTSRPRSRWLNVPMPARPRPPRRARRARTARTSRHPAGEPAPGSRDPTAPRRFRRRHSRNRSVQTAWSASIDDHPRSRGVPAP